MTRFADADLQERSSVPAREEFLRDVLEGLRRSQKTLPCKYFYDERGSRLFDRITQCADYYPTRTELAILRDNMEEIAGSIGPRAMLIEPGAGNALKIRTLLDGLRDPVAYIPSDISGEHLVEHADAIAAEYESIEVLPAAVDFTREFEAPEPEGEYGRRVVFFPGSTIGNFDRTTAARILAQFGRVAGSGGGVLLGVDLVKDREVLRRAYNDSEGVTAAFNMNILRRINDELGGDFDLAAFRHESVWTEEELRIEMRLFSARRQSVRVGSEVFAFEEGESIWTEPSHKHTLESFETVATGAGLRVEKVWTDPKQWFSVQWCRVA